MTTATCDCIHASADLRLSTTADAATRTADRGISLLMHILLTFEAALDRSRERKAMRNLDGHILRDIGLSAADVEREARKPFWLG